MPRARKKPVASSKFHSAPMQNMSNHSVPPAPPYWGPSSYTQPWMPQPPSSDSTPHNLHLNPDPSASQQYQNHNFESFFANANLPGLGNTGATGTFPPPPFAFPGAFPPGAAPPHYAPMPNFGYPIMPMPPAPPQPPQNQPSTSELTNPTHSNTPGSQPMTNIESRQDPDREEGELTDIEAPAMMEQQSFSRSNARHLPKFSLVESTGNKSQQTMSNGFHGNGYHPPRGTSGRQRLQSSELEEGEASPESRSSSRASGSPYNPPMPADLRSPSMPRSVPEALRNQQLPTTGIQTSSGSALSLAQLRVQAQGAILSLAPHSIRYNELVGEGINPAVLKQLYEEVGIKVPTTPPADLGVRASGSENIPPEVGPSASGANSKEPSQQRNHLGNATQKPSSDEASPTPSQFVQANTIKPMERKEVIARMLAAKAAKKSPASTQSQPDAAQVPLPSPTVSATIEKPIASTPSQESSANEKESRVKEKNKAKTELARQRIEQLKKQGLMRNLQKLQADSQVSDKEQEVAVEEPPQPQVPNTIQHPLPERPPLPEPASHDHIPGLFMAGQAPAGTNSSPIGPISDATVESVSQPRSAQRKRPRASDFDDESIPVPKRPSSNGIHYLPPERLVIDISDDEFYGDDHDDDEDVDMHAGITSTNSFQPNGLLAAEGLPRVSQPLNEGLPHRPATSQSVGLSASSTPNILRSSEQEDLRRKDLEIQAMHRRIAELEQRKKAKLASRTQSPRASDVTPPELASLPAVLVPTMPVSNGKDAEELLAPMTADELRNLKAKIVRIHEIECGAPSLDAEIRKTEARLIDAKKEEEILSLELTKGKDGLRQLMEEVNAIRSEVPAVSLDQVNAALASLESQNNLPIDVVQGMLRRLSIPGSQYSNTTTYNNHAIAPGYGKEASDEPVPRIPEAVTQTGQDVSPLQPASPPVSNAQAAENQPDEPTVQEDTSILDAPADEPSDTSMSEDSSSSMDESSDDSSSDSDPSDEGVPDAQNTSADSVAPGSGAETTNAGRPSQAEGLEVGDVPSDNQYSAFVPPNDTLSGAGEIQAQKSESVRSRESSVSEAYEPPEPEESGSASESSYSPAPSPDFPSPSTNMEVSGSSAEQSEEAGETLTEKVQDLPVQQPSHYHNIGALDNARRPEDTQRKFSPYTSPLKMFKAYRYHSDYQNNVSSGYRSLTYSHNIDPLKHLCPFETSGGVCNDRSCEYQHFRDMALSDDKILVQMGSLREGKTTEESDKYVAGLKETINDMRRDKVKDMNTVATEIAAYRRRFLQDPTRVLAL
ncbi:uncharacterized protein BDV14DRAFT_179677 [Aspergillus stella-maris]|uniref:uncharacterized protein n=1 Tax=Aspergillus stella-maris TaxID=1810926 RepID=UPI003CCE19FA